MDIRRPPGDKRPTWVKKASSKAAPAPAETTRAAVTSDEAFAHDDGSEQRERAPHAEAQLQRLKSPQPRNDAQAAPRAPQAPPLPEGVAKPARPRRARPKLSELFFAEPERFAKVRLDSRAVRRALGSQDAQALLALCGTVPQRVYDAELQKSVVREMPFRCSVLTGDTQWPVVVMGATRGSGTWGKVRDCVVLLDEGPTRRSLVLKELRLKPVRKYRKEGEERVAKGPLNRLGRPRNRRSTREEGELEYERSELLGNTIQCHAILSDKKKVWLAYDAFDCDLHALIGETDSINAPHVGYFVGERYAHHLADIHNKGFVHVDGKIENVGVQFNEGTLSLIDFGGAAPYDPVTRQLIDLPTAVTDVAPEVLRGERPGPPHDVWCMGLVILSCINLATPLDKFDARGALVPGPERRPLSAHNKEILNDFVGWRAALYDPATRQIDLERLMAPSGARCRGMLDHAIAVAPELTRYVVAHLLDPDPKTRHSAADAERNLATLSRTYFNLAELARAFRAYDDSERHRTVPAQRLNEVVDFLLQRDPRAFSPPASMSAPQARAEASEPAERSDPEA